MMAKAPREQGFTLIEIIVVIVLFSLITTLSMQGIGYVLGQRMRMAQFQQQMVAATLHHQWFIESIAGLAVPPEDKAYLFTGSAREFHGFSMAPLMHPELPGVYISWRLATEKGVQVLNYYQLGTSANSKRPRTMIPVVQGSSGDAYFRYLDEVGAFHAEWPPEDRSAKRAKFNTLPEAIFLFMAGSGGVSWVARLNNAKNVKVTEQFIE